MTLEKTVTSSIASGPSAPAEARRIVAETLRSWRGEAKERAVLVMSELVSNAVVHGRPGNLVVEVKVGDDAVTVAVTNPTTPDSGHGATFPVAMTGSGSAGRAPDGTGGLGLTIVEDVSDTWGFDPGPPTRVWSTLSASRRQTSP